jgi:hypothetical protein
MKNRPKPILPYRELVTFTVADPRLFNDERYAAYRLIPEIEVMSDEKV